MEMHTLLSNKEDKAGSRAALPLRKGRPPEADDLDSSFDSDLDFFPILESTLEAQYKPFLGVQSKEAESTLPVYSSELFFFLWAYRSWHFLSI